MPLSKRTKANNAIRIPPVILHVLSRSFLGLELTRELLQRIAENYQPGILRRIGIRSEKHETMLALEELENFPPGRLNRKYINLLAGYINAQKDLEEGSEHSKVLKKIRAELDQATYSSVLISFWYFLVCVSARQLFHSNPYEFSMAELFKLTCYTKASHFFTMEFLYAANLSGKPPKATSSKHKNLSEQKALVASDEPQAVSQTKGLMTKTDLPSIDVGQISMSSLLQFALGVANNSAFLFNVSYVVAILFQAAAKKIIERIETIHWINRNKHSVYYLFFKKCVMEEGSFFLGLLLSYYYFVPFFQNKAEELMERGKELAISYGNAANTPIYIPVQSYVPNDKPLTLNPDQQRFLSDSTFCNKNKENCLQTAIDVLRLSPGRAKAKGGLSIYLKGLKALWHPDQGCQVAYDLATCNQQSQLIQNAVEVFERFNPK